MSYREVTNSLGMNNPSLLCNWCITFYKKGIDGLSRQRGSPPKMNKQKKTDKIVHSKQQQTTQEVLSIEKLEAGNRDLRIENEFLKDLRRLRPAEEQQRRNK